jgi:glycosyltransferase involved in cell wall biosynthesis
MRSKKFVFICGSADALVRFRLDFIKDLIGNGYEVIALFPEGRKEFIDILDEINVKHMNISFKRKSVNPINSIVSIVKITKQLKLINPDIVFSFTHKSVVIGSFCAYFANVPYIYSMITGTGHIFDRQTFLLRIKRAIGIIGFKISLGFNKKIFFQNPDDRKLFRKLCKIPDDKIVMINGSGVNLDIFPVTPLPEAPIFMCMARLIKSKGLIEFAEASKILREKSPDSRFLLYGFPDDHNDSIDEKEIKELWFDRYGVEYLGYSDNPQEAISKCSVYVLLSYNEGTPRSVLEAMSMGRPIITTDVSGCRETVSHGRNGLLVKAKDARNSADAMEVLTNRNIREKMSIESRKYCEEKFNVHDVNKKLLDTIK